MNRLTDDEMASMLRTEPRPRPPEDLASRIKTDIPEKLDVLPRPPKVRAWIWLAAAASLLFSVTSWWWRQEVKPDAPAPPAVTVASVPAPASVSVPASVRAPVEPDLAPGEVRAVVTDELGGALPGAAVSVSGPGLSQELRGTTDEAGVARFFALREGEVSVRAELPGFEPAEKIASSSDSASQEVALTLRVQPISESVTVTGESPTIDTATAYALSAEPAGSDYRYRARALDQIRGWNIPPSTGGTREPNDEVYDRAYFQHYGVHPFVDTEDDPLSTFALDVDTGSYSIVRRMIEDGYLPDPDAVRVEEMVNYFNYSDEPPGNGDFTIRLEGAPTPFTSTARTELLRVGIRAREVGPEGRKPLVLTFLVDVSGSMNREDRLGLVEKGLGFLLSELGPEDRVGLVVFGTTARALLEPTTDREAIRRAVDSLSAEGSTNLDEGLGLAYQMAHRNLTENAVNRIILCSDGVANEGRTGWESLLDSVARWRKGGIELSAVGFGLGNYNDILMEQLADHADGNYAYVDDVHEARRVFVYGLTGMLQSVARDAKIQVQFDPEVVESYRLLGYENRRLEDRDFRDDTKDAGEIGLGHRVTALYEVKLHEGADDGGSVASVRLRYHAIDRGEVQELEEKVRLKDFAPSWERAVPSLRLAAVVAELGEILRGSYWAREGSLDQLLDQARKLLPELSENAEVVELVDLIAKARAIER